MQLSYPQILEALTGAEDMGHGNNGKAVLSTARPNNRPVRLEEAEFMARGPFPRATLRRVTTPLGDNGTYRINLRQSGEINQKHPFTMVWIDRWSGQIKTVRDPGQFSYGEKLMTWMWPLHTGEALGGMGRLAWFIAGLCPAYFYVSGLLYWLHKRGMVKDRPVRWDLLRLAGVRLLLTCQSIWLICLPHLQTLWKHAMQSGRVWGEKLRHWLETRQ
jgi:uncharacterized iron-regulated membrane protein